MGMSQSLLKTQMVAAMLPLGPPGPMTELYWDVMSKSLMDSLKDHIKVTAMVSGNAGSPGTAEGIPGTCFAALDISAYVSTAKGQLKSDGFKVDAGLYPATTIMLMAFGQFVLQMKTIGVFKLASKDCGSVSTGTALINPGGFSLDADKIWKRVLDNMLKSGFGNKGVLPDQTKNFHKSIVAGIKKYYEASGSGTAPVAGGTPSTGAASTTASGNFIE